MYIVTKKDYWLKKSILPMALYEKNIDEDTVEMIKCTFENVKVKAGLPSNADSNIMKKKNHQHYLL